MVHVGGKGLNLFERDFAPRPPGNIAFLRTFGHDAPYVSTTVVFRPAQPQRDHL
jgi:hypothetical protein